MLGFLLGFLLRTAMPKRSKNISPHRRLKPVLSWKPVTHSAATSSSDEMPGPWLRRWMPGPWLRRWMPGPWLRRWFVLFKGFRIALPRAFRKASWSADFGIKREHRAVTTLPEGSICFASSSSRWWRYHSHPSVREVTTRFALEALWMNDEVTTRCALEALWQRRWLRMLLAVIGRAIFYATSFLCWRWLRSLFLRASLAFDRRGALRFD